MLLGDRLAEHPEHPLQLLFVYIFGGDRIPQPADHRFIHSSSRVSHNVFQKFHRPAEVKFFPDSTVQPREAKRLVAHRDLSEFAGLIWPSTDRGVFRNRASPEHEQQLQ